ncbi:MAG: 30S ribosomal protein S6 [Firmicutes bacterium]|nr:30S ribosomal protein S6 [Bacillota bacterium]
MNKYELAVVLNPTLDEDALKNEANSVKELIERFGGTVEKVDDWGKRRLAYEIKKLNEGFYSFITFSAESSVPAEIEKRMRIKENVLRYLIVSQEA